MSFLGDEAYLRITNGEVDIDATEERLVDEVKVHQNHELVRQDNRNLTRRPLWDIGEKIAVDRSSIENSGDSGNSSSSNAVSGAHDTPIADSVAFINYTGSLTPDSLDYEVISEPVMIQEGIKYGIPREFYRKLGNSGLYKRIAGHLKKREEPRIGFKAHTCKEFGHQCSVCLEIIPIAGKYVKCINGHTTDHDCAVRWKNSCGLCRSTFI